MQDTNVVQNQTEKSFSGYDSGTANLKEKDNNSNNNNSSKSERLTSEITIQSSENQAQNTTSNDQITTNAEPTTNSESTPITTDTNDDSNNV